MKKTVFASAAAALVASIGAHAEQGSVPTGIPALDHVFVIMMENHAYGQVAGNPQAPFINSMMAKANTGVAGPVVVELAYRNEYIALRGQSRLADEVWHRNKCDVAAPTAPAAAAPAAPAAAANGAQPPPRSGSAVY